MKHLLSLILLTALLCCCAGAEAEPPAKYEGNGFDTPEEAALWYLAGLKNGDFEQMLSAFAWETQAEHIDIRAYLIRYRGTDPTSVPGMPAANGLLLSAMTEQLRDSQSYLICESLETYVNDEMYSSPTGTLQFRTEEEVDEYFRRCDNGRLGNLAEMDNIRFYTPDQLTQRKFSMPRNQENYLKQNAVFGAEETRDVFIAADAGGETIAVVPTVARYGGRWYLVSVSSMTSNIVGIPRTRKAFFVLDDDLKEQLDGEEPVATVSVLPASGGTGLRYEGEGFSSPEEAAECYLNGLKNGDLREMLSACAWETKAARYSLKEDALFSGALYPASSMRIPSLNSFMAHANMISMRHQQFRKIYFSVRNYVLEGEAGAAKLLDGYRINLESEEEVDAFIRMFDNNRAEQLKKMGNYRFFDASEEVPYLTTEKGMERLETNREIYGADEIREMLALADMDGRTVICNLTLVRYGDKWFVAGVGGVAFAYFNVDVYHQAFFVVNGTYDGMPEQSQQ